MIKTRQGQSTAEYAVVISVVIACAVGMQLYVKRGLQAKVKHAANVFSTKNVAASPDALLGTAPEQYEPYYTAAGTYTTTYDTDQTEEKKGTLGGKIEIDIVKGDTIRKGSATQGVDLTADAAW